MNVVNDSHEIKISLIPESGKYETSERGPYSFMKGLNSHMHNSRATVSLTFVCFLLLLLWSILPAYNYYYCGVYCLLLIIIIVEYTVCLLLLLLWSIGSAYYYYYCGVLYTVWS